MKTAVEFFSKGLENLQYNPLEKNGYENAKQKLLDQAKEMEKEQMMEFAMKFMMQDRPIVSFYNEQFKSEQDETGS